MGFRGQEGQAFLLSLPGPPDPDRRRVGRPGRGGEPRPDGWFYFSWFATLVKVVSSLPPSVVMAPIAATAMRAAVRPYSMAVAPDWSWTKRWKRVFTVNLLGCDRLPAFEVDRNGSTVRNKGKDRP